MKKALCILLAAIFIASVLTSCAGVGTTAAIGSHIRVTSSDALDAAAWLESRLGERLSDSVVIGTDAAEYDVDVSTLEADGFFIRSFGREDVLFAKTPEGLDRAVRKYAKMVEAGAVTDVTYHEGARVKRIEIAGRDVSEYTIYTEDEPHILAAANELSARIAEACGVSLAVVTDEPAAPYVALRYVHDEALGYVGHRWSVSEEGVVIECSDAYRSTSASYAVRRFLEKNLGWMGLIYGIEDLPGADLLSIDAGTAFEEKAAFDWARPASGTTVLKYDRLTNNDGFYGERMYCCHGMQSSRFAGDLSVSPEHNWALDQPCWLDETFYEAAREDIVAYIESRVAAGAKLGEDLCFVDVSHGDNSNWCKCKNCQKMYKAEGTHAAEVLTWVNALSDDLNETYPGIRYGVFAYEMTKKPPKTIKPNEHVTISFCYDRCCSAHPLDGSKCTSLDQWEVSGHSNPELTAMLERWLEICDYVSVWDYYMSNGLLSLSFIHNVRDDLRAFYDMGVKQVFGCADDAGFTGNWIAFSLISELYWNIDMSDEEYDALYDRLLRTFYGDAAGDMRQYFDILGRIHEYGSCRTCWGALMEDPSTFLAVDADTYAARYDALFEIIERAARLADSATEEARMTMISCSVIYTGSLCAYPIAKAAGDAARMDELCRRYALLDERLKRYGMDDAVEYKPALKDNFPD